MENGIMNKIKLIGPIVVGLATLILSAQSHADSRVFGNLGIEDAPWSILIGYNDYGRHYYEPRRVEHHHYYHKPRHKYRKHKRHHKRHHRGHAYGHYKHRPYNYSRRTYCPY